LGHGISTWFIALLWHFSDLRRLVFDNYAESSLVILLAMIFAGHVLEDFAARWETWLDNQADSRTEKLHSNQWYGYLQIVCTGYEWVDAPDTKQKMRKAAPSKRSPSIWRLQKKKRQLGESALRRGSPWPAIKGVLTQLWHSR
jgi:hypothetical protein